MMINPSITKLFIKFKKVGMNVAKDIYVTFNVNKEGVKSCKKQDENDFNMKSFK